MGGPQYILHRTSLIFQNQWTKQKSLVLNQKVQNLLVLKQKMNLNTLAIQVQALRKIQWLWRIDTTQIMGELNGLVAVPPPAVHARSYQGRKCLEVWQALSTPAKVSMEVRDNLPSVGEPTNLIKATDLCTYTQQLLPIYHHQNQILVKVKWPMVPIYRSQRKYLAQFH